MIATILEERTCQHGCEIISRIHLDQLAKVRVALGMAESPTRHLLREKLDQVERRKRLRVMKWA